MLEKRFNIQPQIKVVTMFEIGNSYWPILNLKQHRDNLSKALLHQPAYSEFLQLWNIPKNIQLH